MTEDNDREIAFVGLEFVLLEVNYKKIDVKMKEVSENGLAETSSEELKAMLQSFDDYKQQSIEYRSAVASFLKKSKKAQETTEVMQWTLLIDEDNLNVIKSVETIVEYFVKSAIKKTSADRLREQIQFFIEHPGEEYNPDGGTGEEDEEESKEEESTEDPEEEIGKEESIEEETTDEDTEIPIKILKREPEPKAVEIPLEVEIKPESVAEDFKEEVGKEESEEEEFVEDPGEETEKVPKIRAKKRGRKPKAKKTRKKLLTWKRGDADE